jgi:hypothetical protein
MKPYWLQNFKIFELENYGFVLSREVIDYIREVKQLK